MAVMLLPVQSFHCCNVWNAREVYTRDIVITASNTTFLLTYAEMYD
jgi:hypothetical protein